MLERIFEEGLWGSRFMVIMAVIFGLIGAIALFVVASVDVYNVSVYIIEVYTNHLHPEKFHERVVGEIIGAVDLYLIGVVMLLFSFGLYELFISEIDPARDTAEEEESVSRILAIHSLDQLKDKISKVIVMVLVVGFFKKVGLAEFTTPLELLYLALSITAVSVGLYFLSKVGHNH